MHWRIKGNVLVVHSFPTPVSQIDCSPISGSRKCGRYRFGVSLLRDGSRISRAGREPRSKRGLLTYYSAKFAQKLHEKNNWQIQWCAKDASPSLQFLSFSCSFQQKSCQIIRFCQLLRGWSPIWEILDPPLLMKRRPSKGRESLQLPKSANVPPHWRPHPPQGNPASATAISVADLHSKILYAHLSRGPNSFNFMQFLGNFGKIACKRPLKVGHIGEILEPPLNIICKMTPHCPVCRCIYLGAFQKHSPRCKTHAM